MGDKAVGMRTSPFRLLRGWSKGTNRPYVTGKSSGKISCVAMYRMGAMLTVLGKRRRKLVKSPLNQNTYLETLCNAAMELNSIYSL